MKKEKKPRTAVNRDGQASRMDDLNELARAAGWKSLSEYLTAVRRKKAKLPRK